MHWPVRSTAIKAWIHEKNVFISHPLHQNRRQDQFLKKTNPQGLLSVRNSRKTTKQHLLTFDNMLVEQDGMTQGNSGTAGMVYPTPLRHTGYQQA